MTDLGWHQLDLDTGLADPERHPGFSGHHLPACLLLPDATRACFVRSDNGEYFLDMARPSCGLRPSPAWTSPAAKRLPYAALGMVLGLASAARRCMRVCSGRSRLLLCSQRSACCCHACLCLTVSMYHQALLTVCCCAPCTSQAALICSSQAALSPCPGSRSITCYLTSVLQLLELIEGPD